MGDGDCGEAVKGVSEGVSSAHLSSMDANSTIKPFSKS